MNCKTRFASGLWFVVGALAFSENNSHAALSDGLVSYWPMEEVEGTKTPDLVSGYDMNLFNLTSADLVAGKVGKCFNFSNAKQTLLQRIHADSDDLPANKHAAFTISFWANVKGTGQTDLRVFSEAFSPNDNNPLFNLGTHSGGADDSLDLLIRNTGWATVDHIRTTATPFDGSWHHVTFIQRADGSRNIYIDGTVDPLEIAPRPDTPAFKSNDTTIGGIFRASASHWVTGLIDEVAIWKRALSDAEITQLKNEGLVSVFPPEGIGLVSHWPMEEVQGTKTPDVVSGYDMNLNNLTAADLVTGKSGKCFNFSNAKQTLLHRVHSANDDLPANKHAAFTITFWANVAGTGQTDLRVFSEAFSPNDNNPLFNLGTHSTGTDDSLDLLIRNTGWATVDHIRTTATPFDGTWHHVSFVQRADGTRSIYIDGALDPLEIAPRPDTPPFKINDTTIGGILRASPSHWITGLIDEVAIWKRALSDTEIASIKANGVPKVFKVLAPLEIKTFNADFSTVAAGDKVVLHWEGSKDGSFSISGIGDVTAQTVAGVGSREVTVPATSTYTLTLSRGSESLTRQITVNTVNGVAPGWHLLEILPNATNGPLSDQTTWLQADGVFNAVELGTTNKAIGYDQGADLTALRLNAWSIPEGQKATLSFRMYVVPTDPADSIAAIGVHVGLTDRPIRFVDDFNQNVGPYLRIERLADTPSIDLQARNGVATGFYEGQAADAIQPGNWYRVWIDVENKAFDVVNGVQNGGDIYTVYVQKEGDASRTKVFENFVADRDAVTIDPALGAPLKDLSHVFISTPGQGQGVNQVLFDDFFVTIGAFSATVPYTPSNVTAPTQIRISASSYDKASNKFTLTFESNPGVTYRIDRKATLNAVWASASTVTAGAGNSTSYTDNATGPAAFYRVVYQP